MPFPVFLGNWAERDQRPKPATAFPDPVGQSAGVWRGVFRDEFDNGTKPDTTIWADHLIEGDAFRCNDNGTEIQWYTHDRRGLEVGNSILTLVARQESPYTADPLCPNPLPSGNVGTWTSGMIQSKPGFSMSYGYVEASLRHPAAVTGQWPAFWSFSADAAWPPEFDFAEFFNGTQVRCNAFDDAGVVDETDIAYTPPGTYETWGCKWDASSVVWYRDGAQVATSAKTTNRAQHLVLNFAVRSGAGAGPWRFDIDYVRAWVPVGAPAQPAISNISPLTGVPSGGSITATFGGVSGATSYRATACAVDAAADGVTLTHTSNTGASSPITITGLTNGARYTISVCAINASGYSIESTLVPGIGR